MAAGQEVADRLGLVGVETIYTPGTQEVEHRRAQGGIGGCRILPRGGKDPVTYHLRAEFPRAFQGGEIFNDIARPCGRIMGCSHDLRFNFLLSHKKVYNLISCRPCWRRPYAIAALPPAGSITDIQSTAR